MHLYKDLNGKGAKSRGHPLQTVTLNFCGISLILALGSTKTKIYHIVTSKTPRGTVLIVQFSAWCLLVALLRDR